MPSGAVSVTVTVDGRTTLNESACSSATPSPFGETTGTSGGWRVDAVVEEHQRVRDRSLGLVGRSVQDLAVEREGRRAAAVELHPPYRAEPDEGLGHLERRHADRVPGLPAVDGDEENATVCRLTDRAAWMSRCEQRGLEGLVRAIHRPTAADEDGPPADRVADRVPPRLEDEPERHRGADRRLRLQLRRPRSRARRARPSPAAIPTDPFCEVLATVAAMSVLGVEAGKPERSTEYDPEIRGVDVP